MHTILFPTSIFDKNEVDDAYELEYAAAQADGVFDVILFDYDAWVSGGQLVLSHVPSVTTKVVLRSWMMKPVEYEAFYTALLVHHLVLVTDPTAYTTMHLFPNVYDIFLQDTPKMLLFPLHEQIDITIVRQHFERFIIKDYVKSVKGTSFPNCFDASTSQEVLDQWMDIFYRYRGDLLTGGICVKEFVSLKRYGDHTNEYRVFYIHRQIATCSRNAGQPSDTPEPPLELLKKYSGLDSPYYTIDYAELENGTWVVLESGDGGVSGLSVGQDVDAYYRTLHALFNN